VGGAVLGLFAASLLTVCYLGPTERKDGQDRQTVRAIRTAGVCLGVVSSAAAAAWASRVAKRNFVSKNHPSDRG
jgi:hypothetical protein